MKISSTGDGLGIIVKCRPIIAHGWMSFAAWYSFTRNLPDASVAVYMDRGEPADFMMWCWKMRIPFSQSSDKFKCLEKKEIIEITPTIMAIRPFDTERIGPSSVKSNDFTTFVDYTDGCGSFVTAEWIDKCWKPPFGFAVKKYDIGASVAEKKILALWDKCRDIYSVV